MIITQLETVGHNCPLLNTSLPVLHRRLEVQLPKFLLEQSYSLKGVLPALGIRDTDNLSTIGGVQEDFMLSEASVCVWSPPVLFYQVKYMD